MRKGLKSFFLVMLLASFLSPVVTTAMQCVAMDAQNGTLEVIHIRSAQDIKELAGKCSLDTWSQDKKVLLDNDIVLNGEEFTPIPTFGGIFEGGGHTVSGLSITGNGSYLGLFRYVQDGGIVRDLTVKGNVSPSGSAQYIGGIAGSNSGMIDNCKFVGVCYGKNCVGSLTGVNEQSGLIFNCSAEGVTYAEHYAGGIAGQNYGTIESCSNSCSVNTRIDLMDNMKLEDISVETLTTTEDAADITDIGGIAGVSEGVLLNNRNMGDIGYQHKGYNIGGIVGRQSGYISGCINYGKIYGRKEIGGIVGQMEPYQKLVYEETTISKLETQLDVLQDVVNRTIEDARGYSDTVADQLSQMNEYIGNAEDALDILADKTENLMNTDIDEMNALDARVSKALDMLIPVSDSLQGASEDLSKSADKLKDAIDRMQDSGGDIEDTIDVIMDALDTISVNRNVVQEAADALSDALQNLEDGNRKQAIENLKDATQKLSESVTGLSEAADKLKGAEPYLDNIHVILGDSLKLFQDGLESLSDATDDLSDSGEGLSDVLRYLQAQPDFNLAKIDEEFTRAREDFSDSVRDMTDLLNELNHTTQSNNNRLADDFTDISDTLFAISDILIEAENNISETLDKDESGVDISDSDADNEDVVNGKAEGCYNYGYIDGDVNVGGIAGAMAMEHDLDPEDDIEVSGDVSILYEYSTKAVIRNCYNYGFITVKKDCAGGVAGYAELGCIIGCEGYGTVESTDGDYVGGIVGQSKTLVRDSYAKCELSGGNYVGGIAGSAKDMSGCYTLIQVDAADENCGAVAGEITGEYTGNYFVHHMLAAVDGVSYSGKAEPLSFSELEQTKGIPEKMTTFELTFKAGDDAWIIPFTYGDSYDLSKLPVPPDAYYDSHWEEFDNEALYFDLTVHLLYEKEVTCLESEQMRTENKPLLLVEGSFSYQYTQEGQSQSNISSNSYASDSYRVQTLEVETVPSDKDGRKQVVEGCKISIPYDGQETHTIHYLLPEDIQYADIEVLTEDGWIKADTAKDGAYTVFSAQGNEVTMRVVKSYNVWVTMLIAVAFTALFVLVIILFWKRKRK